MRRRRPGPWAPRAGAGGGHRPSCGGASGGPSGARPGLALGLAQGDQLVPQPAHGLDLDAGPLELLPQEGDVDVHGAALPGVLVAPGPAEEGLAGHHPAFALHQDQQQLELLGPQLHRLPGDEHLAPGRVDVHVRHVQHGVRIGRRLDAAQDGLDPGHQLAGVEGLGEVVVRPQLQAHDLVHVVGAGGEHDDGHRAVLAQPAADLPAVHPGHHQIQHDQVRLEPARRFQALLPVPRGVHAEALAVEVEPGELDDALFVVYDQNGGRHGGLPLPLSLNQLPGVSRPGPPGSRRGPPPGGSSPPRRARSGRWAGSCRSRRR